MKDMVIICWCRLLPESRVHYDSDRFFGLGMFLKDRQHACGYLATGFGQSSLLSRGFLRVSRYLKLSIAVAGDRVGFSNSHPRL